MFEISVRQDGDVHLCGRFDAAQVEKAELVFEKITKSCRVDFSELDYISSAGLGVLLITQKRLNESGEGLTLLHLNKYVTDVFRYAGFDTIFTIE